MLETVIAFLLTTPAGIGALTAIGVLVIGKTVENHIDKRKGKRDIAATNTQDAAGIREELRGDKTMLQTQLREAQAAETEWKEKYFALLEEHNAVKNDLDVALSKIEEQANIAKNTLN